MKVLMIGWELPPHASGGLGVASLGLSRALAEDGVEVTFVLPQKMNVSYDFMKIRFANVESISTYLKNAYSSVSLVSKFEGLDENILSYDYVRAALKYAEKIKKVIEDESFDVIHVHDWLCLPAGILAKELTGKPLIVHIHATEYDRTGGHFPNRAVYEIERQGALIADQIIAVSNLTKRTLVEKYFIPEEKIKVVYNGVDYYGKKDLKPTLEAIKELGYKIVLYHGRITLQKGPEYFVRAAKIVSDIDDKVAFVVSGSGDMQEYMFEEVIRLGLRDKFIFAGALWDEEKDRVIQAADVYVMPSVSEPFGIVPLEVIANETPIIISKQSGVSEVIKNALKVDFWDVEEMANKIIAVLSHKPLKKSLQEESLKELPELSWHKAAMGCEEVYSQLV